MTEVTFLKTMKEIFISAGSSPVYWPKLHAQIVAHSCLSGRNNVIEKIPFSIKKNCNTCNGLLNKLGSYFIYRHNLQNS